MLFLTKKKEKDRPLPIDKVVELSKNGKNDNEIIRELKSEGYTYDEIEKTMLLAMKSSVKKQNTNQKNQVQFQQQPQPQQLNQQFSQNNLQGLSLPEGEDFNHLNQQNQPIEMEENTVDVNSIVEDIIQSIVNEKWERVDTRIKEVEKEMEATKKYISSINIPKEQEIDKGELDTKFKEIDTKFDDLEVRIGALEKSFKQLLPSLVENIQSLSNIVEELKNKHEELEHKTIEHIYGEKKPWESSIKE